MEIDNVQLGIVSQSVKKPNQESIHSVSVSAVYTKVRRYFQSSKDTEERMLKATISVAEAESFMIFQLRTTIRFEKHFIGDFYSSKSTKRMKELRTEPNKITNRVKTNDTLKTKQYTKAI
ncbi:hypothetical protein Tco_0980962 [Tanacetum coccineum]